MDSTTPSLADNPDVREARWLQQFQHGLNRLHHDPGEAARIDAIIREVEEAPADGPDLLAEPLVSAGARAGGGTRLSGTRSSGAQPPLEAQVEPTGRTPGKRGRRLRGIDDAVGPAHRSWLEPIRHRFSTTGMTLNELSDRTGHSKSRLSELMRGSGPHPRWVVTAGVGRALGMPMPPMLRLWMNGAREAGKDQSWIDACVQESAVEETSQPLALRALTSVMAGRYTAFAGAFLPVSHQAEQVVAEVFDILWMQWETAMASPNVHRYAWHVLRARVLSQAPRDRDGRVDMSATAFSTAAAHGINDLDELWIHLQETGSLLKAISRLPDNLVDYTVLRYLCGIPKGEIPGILGIASAQGGHFDREARRMLEADLFAADHAQEGPTGS
ncbi:XRE family transcriptional regulator [Streptomyces sp. NPDC001848]|uniref:XRE family transcriptional regulator n=1 Tax=Streptomyces sp. NPDC001848 TaxID=3364618 RepID=UPI00368956A6